jgi:arginyl-tRNA synthetase
MVELPEGKMKSREGTVVDADELIDEMVKTATEMSKELGKLDEMAEDEVEKINYVTAMGALKYFILKVDPRKTILFNPAESIDFNGNTGPFIQYTYARIQSLLRKADEQGIKYSIQVNTEISEKEKSLIKYLYKFDTIVQEAASRYSPALIANYIYELAKEFNQFYHESKIFVEEDILKKEFRLSLAAMVGIAIKNAFKMLGIDVPSRM